MVGLGSKVTVGLSGLLLPPLPQPPPLHRLSLMLLLVCGPAAAAAAARAAPAAGGGALPLGSEVLTTKGAPISVSDKSMTLVSFMTTMTGSQAAEGAVAVEVEENSRRRWGCA